MKMLKDCAVEPGDIIELEFGYMYKCLPISWPSLIGFNCYKYSFRELQSHESTILPEYVFVKQIIKKDPKKEILQKIEEHKSEIQILENQLKEMNSLKVGEVYRVTEEFFKDGVLFYKGEMLYLEFDNNVNHIFRSNISLYKRLPLNFSVSKFELINDPEMKNGLAKFFKGNS